MFVKPFDFLSWIFLKVISRHWTPAAQSTVMSGLNVELSPVPWMLMKEIEEMFSWNVEAGQFGAQFQLSSISRG